MCATKNEFRTKLDSADWCTVLRIVFISDSVLTKIHFVLKKEEIIVCVCFVRVVRTTIACEDENNSMFNQIKIFCTNKVLILVCWFKIVSIDIKQINQLI